MPLVSIVVPVYNDAEYIGQSIGSLTNQTLRDIEIVIVDNFSTDGTRDLLLEMQRNDPRIKLIFHEKNEGHLISRRDGALACTGDYVMYMDADDEYIPTACEELYNTITEKSVDMLQFSTEVVFGKNVTLGDAYSTFLQAYTKHLTGERVFRAFTKGCFTWHVWDKMYRAEICKKAYEATKNTYLMVADDLYVSFFLAYYAQSSYGVDKKYYRYHVERGYTGSEKLLKKVQISCSNLWVNKDCADFLRKEGKYEQYKGFFSGPIFCPLEGCIWLWSFDKDGDCRDEIEKTIRSTWSDPRYAAKVDKLFKRAGSRLHLLWYLGYYRRVNRLRKTLKRSYLFVIHRKYA